MLINIIGSDGSGKTTQIQMLQPWIRDKFKCPVRVITKGDVFNFDRFPECRFFGCSYGELAHEILLEMKGESRALLQFFMLATAIRHYPQKEDEIVLFDGYWHKNYATEAALGIDPEWLRETASFFPIPDVSIFLDIEPEIIVSRIQHFNPYECGGNFECSTSSFIENQTKVFSFLKSMSNDENWIVVNARQSTSAIFEEIKTVLSDKITDLVKPLDKFKVSYG